MSTKRKAVLLSKTNLKPSRHKPPVDSPKNIFGYSTDPLVGLEQWLSDVEKVREAITPRGDQLSLPNFDQESRTVNEFIANYCEEKGYIRSLNDSDTTETYSFVAPLHLHDVKIVEKEYHREVVFTVGESWAGDKSYERLANILGGIFLEHVPHAPNDLEYNSEQFIARYLSGLKKF